MTCVLQKFGSITEQLGSRNLKSPLLIHINKHGKTEKKAMKNGLNLEESEGIKSMQWDL